MCHSSNRYNRYNRYNRNHCGRRNGAGAPVVVYEQPPTLFRLIAEHVIEKNNSKEAPVVVDEQPPTLFGVIAEHVIEKRNAKKSSKCCRRRNGAGAGAPVVVYERRPTLFRLIAEHVIEKRNARKALNQSQNAYVEPPMVKEMSAVREEGAMRDTRDVPGCVDEKKDWALLGLSENGGRGNMENRESVLTLETAPPEYGDVVKGV